MIGELYYVCLTSKVDCPSSAILAESCCQIFLQRLRSVYKELYIPLVDLSKNLTNLAEDDLSKPLKKMIVSNRNSFYNMKRDSTEICENFQIVEINLEGSYL